MKKEKVLYSNALLVLCILLCSLFTVDTHGQACGPPAAGTCTPASGLSVVGFYPTDTAMPCANDGSEFNQTISFYAPSSVDGYSLENINISQILNLPCGLCWGCNTTTINGGSAGCIQVSGFTNEVPGQYNVIVYATASVSTPIGTVTTGVFNVDSLEGLTYFLRVIAPGASTCPPIASTSGTASTPGSISAPGISGNTQLCAGGSTTLTATGGDYYGYAWSNGTYGQSTTVTSTGNYKVTVYDNCNSATAGVSVTPSNATATITPSGSTSFCQGGNVTLTATQGSAYAWSDGETTQSILVSETETLAVTVTLNGGCVATSAPTIVTDNPIPVAVITPSGSLAICDGGSVILTANAGDSYKWSTNAISQSITVSGAATYSVTVTTPAQCSASTSAAVTVNPPATATITAGGPTTFCSGGSVTLTASSGTAYSWSNGSTTQSITASQSGNYSVTVTLSGGCLAVSSPITVTATQQTATITVSGNSNVCSGGSVTLTASQGASYAWSTTATTQSITVSTAGNYTVTVTSAGGCQAASAPTPVSLSPAPTITASGPLTFTQGGSVTLTATAGNTYLWSGGSTSQSITVGTCGVYTAIVYFPGGCASATAPVTVTVNP